MGIFKRSNSELEREQEVARREREREEELQRQRQLEKANQPNLAAKLFLPSGKKSPDCRDVYYVVLVVLIAVLFVPSIMGWLFMVGGHGGIPGDQVSKASAEDTSSKNYMTVYEKEHRLSFSGYVCFYAMLPGPLLLLSAVIRVREMVDLSVLATLAALVGLTGAAVLVDITTSHIRYASTTGMASAGVDNIKKVEDGRGVYQAGVILSLIVHLAFLILSVLVRSVVYDGSSSTPLRVQQWLDRRKERKASRREAELEPNDTEMMANSPLMKQRTLSGRLGNMFRAPSTRDHDIGHAPTALPVTVKAEGKKRKGSAV